MTMNLHDFQNTLRIMLSIDRWELDEVDLDLNGDEWTAFRNDPFRWLIRANDADAFKMWTLIEARHRPTAAKEDRDEAAYGNERASSPEWKL